jgi:hypothetical protein
MDEESTPGGREVWEMLYICGGDDQRRLDLEDAGVVGLEGRKFEEWAVMFGTLQNILMYGPTCQHSVYSRPAP